MQTLVELFDKEPIENVLGTCIFQPAVVIFLCDTRDSSFFKESAVYRIIRRRGLKTVPRFYYFDTTNPAAIRRVLAAVVRDYPGCVFEFSGGRDLLLLEAGAYCVQRGVPGFYIDLPTGRFINVQNCEALQRDFELPRFSTEDVLALSGATIYGDGHFDSRKIDAGFEEDILAVWQVVQKNPKAWDAFVAYLQAVAAAHPAQSLTMQGPPQLRQERRNLRPTPEILHRLAQAGVIRSYKAAKSGVSFTYKSALHKKCLLNQGIWLELYCYVVARRSGYFDDVRTSVVIDWDGVEGGEDTTKNEVDVLLVKGVTPAFISCKMSIPSPLALSEIRLLSAKFGGAHSRTMVVTAGHIGTEHKAVVNRAADLGITLLGLPALQSGRLEADLVAAFNLPRRAR